MLNPSLQGSNTHILKLAEKISAFRKLGEKNEDCGKDCLHLLQHFVTSNEVDLTQDLITVFEEHLNHFSDYFKKKHLPEDFDNFA
jgi:hypothetical protein